MSFDSRGFRVISACTIPHSPLIPFEWPHARDTVRSYIYLTSPPCQLFLHHPKQFLHIPLLIQQLQTIREMHTYLRDANAAFSMLSSFSPRQEYFRTSSSNCLRLADGNSSTRTCNSTLTLLASLSRFFPRFFVPIQSHHSSSFRHADKWTHTMILFDNIR